MDSILNSIKELLGIPTAETSFDAELVIIINSAISVLNQLGYGEKGFGINGNNEKWADLCESINDCQMIKTYIYLKTKMVFDPPATGSLMDALNRTINEHECRITYAADSDS